MRPEIRPYVSIVFLISQKIFVRTAAKQGIHPKIALILLSELGGMGEIHHFG